MPTSSAPASAVGYVNTPTEQEDPEADQLPPPYESLPERPPQIPARNSGAYSYVDLLAPNTHKTANAKEGKMETQHGAEQYYIGPDIVEVSTTETYCTPVGHQLNSHVYRSLAAEQAEGVYEMTGYETIQQSTSAPQVPPTDGRRQIYSVSQATVVQVGSTPKHKSWLPWSIVTLVILCLPLGIPATILSALSTKDFKQGKLSAAKKKATAAFVLNIIGTVCGGLVIFTIIGGALLVAGVLAVCCK